MGIQVCVCQFFHSSEFRSNYKSQSSHVCIHFIFNRCFVTKFDPLTGHKNRITYTYELQKNQGRRLCTSLIGLRGSSPFTTPTYTHTGLNAVPSKVALWFKRIYFDFLQHVSHITTCKFLGLERKHIAYIISGALPLLSLFFCFLLLFRFLYII